MNNRTMTSPTASSPFDFLLTARLPILDNYFSESSQSILCEIIFWGLLYLLYARYMSEVFRQVLTKFDF